MRKNEQSSRRKKLLCTEEDIDKNKNKLPPPSPHSSFSFLNCWKTTKAMSLKFSDFQSVLNNCFVKNRA